MLTVCTYYKQHNNIKFTGVIHIIMPIFEAYYIAEAFAISDL